ncbi:MAG: helix-turn-helix domain-containing protein [Oscillospiraceae bacterium]|nr:helix-turn-helix domain-containing protein [Oscillospiraceae bacterium]
MYTLIYDRKLSCQKLDLPRAVRYRPGGRKNLIKWMRPVPWAGPSFGDRVNWDVYPDPGIDLQQYQMIPLLLQPLIENAITHGLEQRKHNGHIRLPGMDGTKVIQKAREMGFSGEVIFLTAYSDFAYAQQAIRYGAAGYLIKLKNDFARLLMSGAEESGETQVRGIEALQIDQQQVLLLMSPAAISRFQAWIGHLQERFEKNSYMDSIFFVYGEVVPQLGDIGRSYHQCQELIRRRFFCSENQHMLAYLDLPVRDHPRQAVDDALCTKLSQLTYDYLQLRQAERIRGVLVTLGQLLYENDLAGLPGKHVLIDYLLQIKQKVISGHGPGVAELFDSNSAIINLIEGRHYLYEITAYFNQQFERIMARIGVSSGDNVIESLLQYVQVNYGSKLTLEQLAGQFGYNSSYLGRLFAEKQGCSFNHYLEAYRIDQARQLLKQTTLRIYEIAEKTGFKYTDDFTAKFKKHVGCTPQQYRRRQDLPAARAPDHQEQH